MNAELRFPKDFLFGVATSAYQIEGAWNEDGKGESIWDRYCHNGLGCVKNNDTGDVAIDDYHRYNEDLDIIKSLNCDVYRFSIAWSRILPDGTGKINQKGIDYYNKILDGLLERGIKPAVTLFHWDLPAKLQSLGGWANREIVKWFTYYAEICFKNFGNKVDFWITINEPTVFAFSGYSWGAVPPCIKDCQMGLDAAHNCLLAHGSAVRLFRKMNLSGKIGAALDIIPKLPVSDDERDIIAAKIANSTTQYYFYEAMVKGAYPELGLKQYAELGCRPDIKAGDMELISEPCDFIGLNYYITQGVRYKKGSGRFDYEIVKRKNMPCAGDEWEIDPDYLVKVLKDIKNDTKSDIPVLITENGIFCDDYPSDNGEICDDKRIDYMLKHLKAIHQAIDSGVNVIGYINWSVFDNFEWNNGNSSRFGLVYIDYNTLERTVKKSGKWYSEFIKSQKSNF